MDDASRRVPEQTARAGNPVPDTLVGRTINDRYKVVGLVARGGMGKVYRAEQAPLGRLVALKVLNPNYTGDGDPEFHKRFFLEASIASKLTHPNTVTIFDYGRTDDDIYYIAMELLEGRTLHRALREERPFAVERVMHIGRQICRSLREAHDLGVIHRDLKPANVYLMQHGDEEDFVKLLDFGLVKNLEGGEDLTQNGLFMGSPKYMSPEQIRGDRVDTRVDIYSLGVMLYEMLTGKVPFDRANSVNILMAHIQESVPPMAEMAPEVKIPAPLEETVRRCMAKSPAERFASMDEVLAALKHCAGMSPLLSGEFSLQTLNAANPRSSSVAIKFEGPNPSDVTPTVHGLEPSDLSDSSEQPVVPRAPPASSRGRTTSVRPSKAPYIMLILAALMVLGVVFMMMPRGLVPGWAPPVPTPATENSSNELQELPAEELAGAKAEPNRVPTVLVSLRSTPSGATVVVNEHEYGPTPTQVEWRGEDARPGREVTFRFQRKGYRDLSVTRTIRGATLEVEAPPLDPIPVRRVSPGSRTKSAPRTKPDPPAEKRPRYKEAPY